ncbi:MAG: cytochrome c3 family protein [Thermincola sp.]|nr:cytochrome c3 family protein [Thermincola sp.]MDT3702343.1 cytochrome c3 family protein [Thermincola sp.]
MNRRKHWLVSIFLVMAVLAAGCQTARKPEPAPGNETRNQAAEFTTLMEAAGKDSHPDGCVSCHKKAGNVDRSLPAYVERISGHPEVKETTINACYVCHDPQKNFNLYKSFLRGMHKVHWESESFYGEFRGQCYSCHTVETNGVSGIKNYPQAGYREGAAAAPGAGAGTPVPRENTGRNQGTQSKENKPAEKQSNEQKQPDEQKQDTTEERTRNNNNRTDELPVPTP